MANHKSAAKRARQSVRKNTRNTARIGAVRTLEKKLRAALTGNDADSAKTLLNGYMSQVTKAASKGTLHAKTAARKVSRLAERVSALSAKK